MQKEKQTVYSIGVGIISILLSSLFASAFLVYYQKQKRLEEKQKCLQAEKKIDFLLTDVELQTTYARIEGQDKERKRIAQNLHDGVGSMLTTVKLYFSSIEEKLEQIQAESREQYQKANDLLDQACDEVRRVSHEMKSGKLADFGLASELKAMAKVISESKKLAVQVITYQMQERLDLTTEIQIYRIVQKLVSNTLKRAKADKFSIELNRFDNGINLLVEDNGIGFEIEMPKLDGIKATEIIKKQYPTVKILILSMYNRKEYIAELMRLGAAGYILKNKSKEELVNAIHSVHGGNAHFSLEVLNELAKNTAPTFEEKVELSDRQKEILIKIGEGFSTKQIAEALFISEHTVNTHRRNLLKKYNVPSDNHLVRIAIKLGFIDL